MGCGSFWKKVEGGGVLGRGGGEGGGHPSEIDHLLSPLRSRSAVAVSKQPLYGTEQTGGGEEERDAANTTIWRSTISMFKQGTRECQMWLAVLILPTGVISTR